MKKRSALNKENKLRKLSTTGPDGKIVKIKKPKMTDEAFFRIRNRKEAEIRSLTKDIDKIPRKEAIEKYKQARKLQRQIDAADKRYDELKAKSNAPAKEAPGTPKKITEKEFGTFKLRSGNRPSPARLMGVTRKPSVLKSNTDGVFDIMTKRKVKRTAKKLANEQLNKYKKLYRRAKRGDIEGIYKDQKRSVKKLFKSVKRIFN